MNEEQYKQEIHAAEQIYKAKPNSATVNSLSDAVTKFVKFLRLQRDYPRAHSYLEYIFKEIQALDDNTEYNRVSKSWLFGRHYQQMAEVYAAQEQWLAEFDCIMRARLAYSNTKDHKTFIKMNNALVNLTVLDARFFLIRSQTDPAKAKERGWTCVKNALILTMCTNNEEVMAELIYEFSQYLNMPLLLAELHQDLPKLKAQPHYQRLNLTDSQVGKFVGRLRLSELDMQFKPQANVPRDNRRETHKESNRNRFLSGSRDRRDSSRRERYSCERSVSPDRNRYESKDESDRPHKSHRPSSDERDYRSKF